MQTHGVIISSLE